MSTGENIGNNGNPKEQNLWEKMANKMPTFFEHMKNLRTKHRGNGEAESTERHAPKHNQELQTIYNLAINEQGSWEASQKIEEFNCKTESPFLASGQSSYFNGQIDENGMKGLKLRKEDIEDAKYIAECFGKEINLSDDGLDKIFYMPRYLVLPR